MRSNAKRRRCAISIAANKPKCRSRPWRSGSRRSASGARDMASTAFEAKLDKVVRRHAELRDAMADPSRGSEFAKLSKEYSDLTPLVEGVETWQKARAEYGDLKSMIAEGEGEMKALAEEELRALDKRI